MNNLSFIYISGLIGIFLLLVICNWRENAFLFEGIDDNSTSLQYYLVIGLNIC